MSELAIVKTVFLSAPPDHVWKFLTEKERLATWFYEAGADITGPGDFHLVRNSLGREGEKQIWGEVLEYDPPRKLVHTFTHGGLSNVVTTCTWTLTGMEGGTILRLEHTGFENLDSGGFDMAGNHDKGWDEFFVRLRHVTR